jgi:hypothetical protein
MSRFVLSLVLSLSFAVAACSSSEETCDGAGDCPAGSICSGGVCEGVLTPSPDVAPRPDTGGVYDAGPVADNGPVRPPIDASVLFPDVGFDLDAASSVPPRDVQDSPADVMPPMMDVPVVNVLTLGDTCDVPDFDQGETDPCSIDNPNYYCLATLDGQSGYCTQSCTLDDHEEEEEEGDAGFVDNNCGNGCCVPQDPNAQPAPGEPVDALCRFAPDCN